MFEGLKILELASVLAGPSVGQFFAELGAEVIKIENPKTNGDVTRSWKLPSEESDVSAYFSAINWGKKSVGIDISQEEGKQLVYDLIMKADVVIVSYKPGDAEKLGMNYETLRSFNSKLIYGHITGYGLDDHRVGYDAIIQAEAGFMYMNGEANGQSLKMPVALVDVLAGHQLKEALLLALIRKLKTGKGSYVHVSLIASAIAALVNQATNYLVAGVVPEKKGSAHPNIAPYGEAFKCADGLDVLLAVGNDKQFDTLCKLVGLDELIDDVRFTNNANRVKNRAKLNAYLSVGLAEKDSSEWIEAFQKAKIPCGSILPMNEVFQQEAAQNITLSADNATGIRTFVGNMGKVSHLTPPVTFGTHTTEVLRNILGFNELKINDLKNNGVIK